MWQMFQTLPPKQYGSPGICFQAYTLDAIGSNDGVDYHFNPALECDQELPTNLFDLEETLCRSRPLS
jgi:hypothetical protein